MKVAFFSNFLNHHQLPLCLELFNNKEVDFTFIATERIPEERLQMKYEDMNEKYPFVLRTYENSESEDKALRLSIEADIVIIGSAPNKYIEDRLKKYNKLTFRFCERSLKKGLWRRHIPRTRKRIIADYIQYKNSNLYILCASAYTSHDIAICGFDTDKCYKWGYFPEIMQYNNIKTITDKKKKNSIIWVGRFIEFKHPELVLEIASTLKKKGYKFVINMIGDGPIKDKILNKIRDKHLEDFVFLTGALTTEEVRKKMLNSQVFLSTSDFYEGWGAVVNEAMNSLCVPVVTHACGSAAFLINSGKNGYIYKYDDCNEAVIYIQKIFENKQESNNMAVNAYERMIHLWNAKTAADRLLLLSKELEKGNNYYFESGPCSNAPVLKNNWYGGADHGCRKSK